MNYHPYQSRSYHKQVTETLDTIRGLGLRAWHDPSTCEFCIEVDPDNCDCDYYTDDPDNAINMAHHVAEQAIRRDWYRD